MTEAGNSLNCLSRKYGQNFSHVGIVCGNPKSLRISLDLSHTFSCGVRFGNFKFLPSLASSNSLFFWLVDNSRRPLQFDSIAIAYANFFIGSKVNASQFDCYVDSATSPPPISSSKLDRSSPFCRRSTWEEFKWQIMPSSVDPKGVQGINPHPLHFGK